MIDLAREIAFDRIKLIESHNLDATPYITVQIEGKSHRVKLDWTKVDYDNLNMLPTVNATLESVNGVSR
jgi:hypothetical protein